MSDQRDFAQLVADAVSEHGSQTALARWLTDSGYTASQQNVSRWLTGSLPDVDSMEVITGLLGGKWESVLRQTSGRFRRGLVVMPVPEHVADRFAESRHVDEDVLRVAWEAAAGAFEAVLAGFSGTGRLRRANRRS